MYVFVDVGSRKRMEHIFGKTGGSKKLFKKPYNLILTYYIRIWPIAAYH